MLIRLTLNNFLSFREEVSFSMVPTREKQHSERVFSHKERELSILPIAALYGANGSGKSNFYKAVEFLRDLVLSPAQNPDEQIPVRPFRLDAGSESAPSRFCIEVLAPDDRVYRLTLLVTKERVLEEKLEFVGASKDRLIYRRDAERAFEPGEWYNDALPVEEREFLTFKARDTLPNQLFLAALRGRNIRHVDGIIRWFKNGLQLMTPNTLFKQLDISLSAIQGLRQYCIDALVRADTGIAGLGRRSVHISELPWDEIPIGTDVEKWLRKIIPVGRAMLMAGPSGERFTIRHEETGLVATRLTTVHRAQDGREVEFLMSEESDGTQRFVDLLPAFYDLGNSDTPKVFVIDEIDRSLHTTLTQNLIGAYVKGLTERSRSQLIFTAHDVLLMNQDLLRRDEVWFAEKDSSGNSTLIPLGEQKGVRADRVIMKSYLHGDFGGLPRISGLPHAPAKVRTAE
jgi:hypothetical protein